jgi:hypothetical protein
MYEHLLRRFNKHPPIDFGKLNDGDSVLFSYFFKNLFFPLGFRAAGSPAIVGGKACEAMEYYPFNAAHTSKAIHFYKSPDSSRYALKYDLPGNKVEAVFLSYKDSSTFMEEYQVADGLVSDAANEYNLGFNASVVMPVLDFSLGRRYSPEELKKFGNTFRRYKVVEERIKFKTTLPENEESKKILTHPKGFRQYVFNSPCLFYMKKKGDELPYFVVRISHPELLLPQ